MSRPPRFTRRGVSCPAPKIGSRSSTNGIDEYNMTAKRLLPLIPVLGVIATGGLPCHWQAAPAAAAQTIPAQQVPVSLAGGSLTPAHFQVPPGAPVRLLVTNRGALAPALGLEGDGVYAETNAIANGQTARLGGSFAAPGIYDTYCPLAAGQRRALGQDGKIAAGPDAAALLDDDSLPGQLDAPATDVPATDVP